MIFTVAFLGLLAATVQLSEGSSCTNQGGTCLNWYDYKCTAGYETGLCPGDDSNRCCLKCDQQCVNTNNGYDDSACEATGGACWDNSNYCAANWVSGLCGGPANRQCCTSSSGNGECGLVSYSASHLIGYNGLTIWVDPPFTSSLDVVNSYAIECDVTVEVTQAFRVQGEPVNGAVVPPATYSNHLVGHAIDMNLNTPVGWCNGDCLDVGSNSAAASYGSCFTNKILADSSLRWGGIWSPPDSVHIDDDEYYNDPNEWNALYYDYQANCQNIV